MPSLVSLMSPAPPTSLQDYKKCEKINYKKIEKLEASGLHFDGALGAEVGFEDVLQTLGGVDVHVQSRRFVQHLRIRVQHSQRHRLLLLLLLVLELKPKRL